MFACSHTTSIKRRSQQTPFRILWVLVYIDVILENTRHVATVLTLASPTSKLAISTPRSLLACSLRVVSASSSLAMVVAFSCLGLELTFRMIRDVSGLNTPQSKIRNIHSVSTKESHNMFSLVDLVKYFLKCNKQSGSFSTHVAGGTVYSSICPFCVQVFYSSKKSQVAVSVYLFIGS